VGSYHADVYYRYELGPGTYLPEQLFGNVSFDVQTSAGVGAPCAPGVITIASGGFQRAAVGTPFAEPITVEDSSLTPDQQPGATQLVLLAGTDAQGMARFNVTANTAGGTYQYKATFAGVVYSPEAYAVLDNRVVVSPSDFAVLPIVEFYNAARDHYFISQSAAEQQVLDLGLAQG
jgi:hypothetical protein